VLGIWGLNREGQRWKKGKVNGKGKKCKVGGKEGLQKVGGGFQKKQRKREILGKIGLVRSL